MSLQNCTTWSLRLVVVFGRVRRWCWPGSSSYLDVTSPVVREWWAQQFTLDKYQGSTKHLYIW
jgi:hypothetical protein